MAWSRGMNRLIRTYLLQHAHPAKFVAEILGIIWGSYFPFKIDFLAHYFFCHESNATPVIVIKVPAIFIQLRLSLRNSQERNNTSNT